LSWFGGGSGKVGGVGVRGLELEKGMGIPKMGALRIAVRTGSRGEELVGGTKHCGAFVG